MVEVVVRSPVGANPVPSLRIGHGGSVCGACGGIWVWFVHRADNDSVGVCQN